MEDRRGAALLLVVGRSAERCGDVVAIASPRSGRGGRPSLSLSAGTSGRGGERLAMVWTVKTSDGAEERRGTGEEVGGILLPGSLSSFPSSCSFALPCPYHLKEGKDEEEDDAGRIADRRGSALLFACCWSIGCEVVAIASPRTGRGGCPSSRSGCWCDGGDMLSGWRWCGR